MIARPKAFLRGAAVAIGLSSGLGGCNFSASVDTLLSPPRLTVEQEQIYQALQATAGSNISLKYPKSGERLSAFTVQDLDGDGQDEAIVFYEVSMTTAEENPLRVCLLDQHGGAWRAVTDYTTPGAEVECVIVAKLGDHTRTNLIIGYSMVDGGGHTAEVFHYAENQLVRTLTVPYTNMDICDLDCDGNREFLVVAAATLSSPATATVYALDAGGSYYQSQVALPDTFTDINRLVYGNLPLTSPAAARAGIALYIDGVSGATTVQTEVLTYADRILKLQYADSTDRFPNTTRNVGCPTVDIDLDGEAEIPIQTVFYGYSNAEQSEQIPMTNWYVSRNGLLMRDASSYYSATDAYAFLLPARWEKKVTAVQGTDEMVFYEMEQNTDTPSPDGRPRYTNPLLRLTIVTDEMTADSKQREGYLLLQQRAGKYYLAKIEKGSRTLTLTTSELLFAMRYL